jgi:fatty acid-binding protein DegV
MGTKIIVDSCCDMTDSMKKGNGPVRCTDKVGSASPSPYRYACAMEENQKSFVVTLSSQLSGSYSSAVLGKSMAEENKGVSKR